MSRLGKWGAGLFIAGYLSILSFGIVAHALKVGVAGNTLSYYFVWDMFCGWHAYDQRVHLIAESTSGRYYEVKEPWGEFCPFGSLGRYQYDAFNNMTPKHIKHVLTRSSHEPIDAVYMVQEIWPKQYNLPESLWRDNFGRDRDKVSYYHLRAVCDEQGRYVRAYPDWLVQQRINSVADNPRLRQEVRQASSSFGKMYLPSNHVSGPTSSVTGPATN